MVLVVTRPQCAVASAGVGIVVGCVRDRTSKEMVSPDRSDISDLVANAVAVSAAASAYNIPDVVVAAAAVAATVTATATAAVIIAAVTTATAATVNPVVAAAVSHATANTAIFDDASMITVADAEQAATVYPQTV